MLLFLLLLLTIIVATLGFGFAAERMDEFVDDGHDASQKRAGLMTNEGYRGNGEKG